MRGTFRRTFERIDNALEVLVFDWALHPSRRVKTLGMVTALGAGLACGLAPEAPKAKLTPAEHLARGTELLPLKAKAKAAARHLNRAANSRTFRNDAAVWQKLGHAELNRKRPHRAVQAYTRALELDDSVTNLFYLGYGYVKADLPEVAVGVYQQILDKNAFFYPAIAYEGVAHDKAGRYRVAENRFRQALAYNPDYLPAHFHLGITYVNTKEYAKSIRAFEKVIELDPSEAAAYYNIACCFSLMGETDKALEWLQTSVDKGFNDYKHMDQDTDLDNIRDAKGFRQIRKAAKVSWKAEAAS